MIGFVGEMAISSQLSGFLKNVAGRYSNASSEVSFAFKESMILVILLRPLSPDDWTF
jgi:hypothetical protein